MLDTTNDHGNLNENLTPQHTTSPAPHEDGCYSKKGVGLCVVVHTCNPSTQEAKAGGH